MSTRPIGSETRPHHRGFAIANLVGEGSVANRDRAQEVLSMEARVAHLAVVSSVQAAGDAAPTAGVSVLRFGTDRIAADVVATRTVAVHMGSVSSSLPATMRAHATQGGMATIVGCADAVMHVTVWDGAATAHAHVSAAAVMTAADAQGGATISRSNALSSACKDAMPYARSR